jgi:hypothetical protein
LPTGIYGRIKQAIFSYCDTHDQCGTRGRRLSCWDLHRPDALGNFPTIRWKFGTGSEFLWRPRSYLYLKQGSRTFCLGFEDNGDAHETVLGATWMLHSDIIFDIEGRRLGYAEARCPVHRKRPAPPTGTIQVDGDVAVFVQNAGWNADEASGAGAPMALLLASFISCSLAAVWRNLRIAAQRANASTPQFTLPQPYEAVHSQSSGSGAVKVPENGRPAAPRIGKGVPLEMWWRATSAGGESTGTDGSSEASADGGSRAKAPCGPAIAPQRLPFDPRRDVKNNELYA